MSKENKKKKVPAEIPEKAQKNMQIDGQTVVMQEEVQIDGQAEVLAEEQIDGQAEALAEEQDKSQNLAEEIAPFELIALWRIFLVFFKIGITTFGGGYAMLSVMDRELVGKLKWIASDEMLNMTAIGESTPGAISLNLSTFIGQRLRGFRGAFVATLGVVSPSFIIISLISLVIDQIHNNQIVEYVFMGIRAGVAALLVSAVIKFFKKLDKTPFALIVLSGAFMLALLTNIDIVWIIAMGGTLGIIYSIIVAKAKGDRDDMS